MARNVTIDIKAKTAQYERALKGATRSTKGLTSSLGDFAKTGAMLGAAGVAAGITAIGVAAVKVGVDSAKAFATFEKSLSQMEGLVGVAQDQVVAFGEAIGDLAVEAGRGPQELADAMFFITSAGLEGEEALDALEVSAKAAAAGLGETVVVADVVTSAMNAYGDQMSGAAEATDVLVATVREGKAAAPELAAAMGQVIPIASSMGVSFDQVGAAMAAMTRVGINSAESATALRAVLQSLLSPTTDANKALGELGLSAAGLREELRDRGLFSTLEHMVTAFDGQADATARVFGNVRALTGVMALMGENASATEGIFDSLATSTGALDTAFGVAADTGAFAFEQAKARIETALLDIGKEILPQLADALTEVMPKLEDMIGQVGELSIAMVDFAAAAVPVVLSSFSAMETSMLNFQIGLLEVKKSVEGFNNVADVLIGPWANIPDTFNAVDQSLQTWLLSQREINRELASGAEPIDLAARALNHLADAGALTSDRFTGVQAQIGLTAAEMYEAATAASLYGRTTARTVEDVARMEAALAELVAIAQGELVAGIRKVGGANEYLGSSAGAAASGIEDETDALGGDIIQSLTDFEEALLGAEAAQMSLADAVQGFADPTFKAVKAMEGLTTANTKLGDVQADDTATAGDLAAAQLAVVEATLKAQGALDSLTPIALEAAMEAITTALGISDQKARDLLTTLGILDGQDVTNVVTFETRVTGPMSGALGGGGTGGYDLGGGRLGYADGGVVPGPVGAPQLAVVHGGEEVLTPAQRALRPSGGSGGSVVNLTFNVASERAIGDIQTALVVAGVTDLVDLGRAAM